MKIDEVKSKWKFGHYLTPIIRGTSPWCRPQAHHRVPFYRLKGTEIFGGVNILFDSIDKIKSNFSAVSKYKKKIL